VFVLAKYDMSVINSIRKPYCELCGSPAHGWPHHIKTRGAGGKDVPENLIQLCALCHDKAQQYKIPRRTLIEIVARREGVSVEEIYRKNNWSLDGKLPHEVYVPNPVAGKTFEEVLELYLFCLENGENSIWDRAAVITVMHDSMGLKPRQIASAIGCSASQVRKMTRVFNVFPREEDRIPYLSFRHHQIAAHTTEPQKWLTAAMDNQWSTRRMQEEIKGSVSPDSKEDQAWEKAERVLLLAEEVLTTGNEAGDWLQTELKKLIHRPVRLSA
jgi:hypothetical protein